MTQPVGWHSRGYLPHYDDGKAIQTICYRLADSLPARVMERLEEQTLNDEKRRAAIEHYLDAGHGSSVLQRSENAEAVLASWRHCEDREYRLHAWVVMPNHVHVLVEPLGNRDLGAIIGAWKSVSARKILAATNPAPNRRAKRRLWQADYYDRFIRNEGHYFAAVDYIHQNPVKAGLVSRADDWPWSSAGKWAQKRGELQET